MTEKNRVESFEAKDPFRKGKISSVVKIFVQNDGNGGEGACAKSSQGN